MATTTTTASTVIPAYNLTDFKKFTTATTPTNGTTSINLAIQTAAISAKPAQFLLGGDGSSLISTKATTTTGSKGTTLNTPETLLKDLLPSSTVTNKLTAADSFLSKLAFEPFEATKNSTAQNYILNADSINNGDAKMTLTVAIKDKKPYAGNGTVAEVLSFNDSQGDKLVIKSVTASLNKADKSTKIGYANDALSQAREVSFINKDISSNYKFNAQHQFIEDKNGNQALVDTTAKIYNHSDSDLKISSTANTAITQKYADFVGVSTSNSLTDATYSYDSKSTPTHLDYTMNQSVAYNKSATGMVTLTTRTEASKFNFTSADVEIIAKGTVTTSTGKADVFSDNAQLSIQNKDYSLVVTKFVTGDFLKDLLSSALSDNTQVFSNSFKNAKTDQGSALKSKFFKDVFAGTSHNDSISILKKEGGKVEAGAGDDEIVGSVGADIITGGIGNDVLTGGAGDDKFIFSALGKDTDLDTTAGKITDTITDFKVGTTDIKNTISGFGAAGSATNFVKAPATVKTLAELLTDADAKLDGTIQFYVGQVGTNSYLITDNDGTGYTGVIQLTGVKTADISFADIVA